MKSGLRATNVVLCFAFLIYSAALYAAGPVQELRVTDAEGPVAVIPKGKTAGSPAAKGLPLEPGDRLVTGPKGRVELASKEGTILELKEGSYLRLQNVTPGKTSFFLKVGRLLGRFAPSQETGIAYRVRTPVAVAAVRGTELGVAVADDGQTEAGVIEGKVDFRKPRFGPSATMNWSDEDPRFDEEDVLPAEAGIPTSGPSPEDGSKPDDASVPVAVESGEGISVKPESAPEKLSMVPPVIVSELRWFSSVRDRVPKLREEWKDLDVPTKMKMRQAALRERITWQIPAKLQPAKPAPAGVRPEKITPAKKNIPKPH